MSFEERFVELPSGVIVRVDALALADRLSLGGHELEARAGVLHVSQAGRLTPEDRLKVVALKLHLLAIAAERGRAK